MDDKTMGQRIAAERKRLGISQEQLGEKTGVSRQAISKWEADGAVPEIDKLIALSRLFGVSVGWLLGVEKQPEQQPEELTESQLKMVEEIVKRYQPKPAISRNFAIALLGVVGITAICISSFFARTPAADYSSQISRLESSYSGIQVQLSALSGRMDGLSAAIEEANSPLAGYQFHLEPNNETETLTVTIQAVPRTLVADGEATLYVRLDGSVYTSAPFQWDTNAYTATVDVAYDTGYEYWMTLEVNGGRESVQLQDTTAQNPQKQYSITCTITPGNWRYIADASMMKLYGYDAHLRQPYITAHADEHWEYAEWTLYHIRGSHQDIIFTESALIGGDANFTESWAHLNADISLPELQDGDRLELRYRAKLDGGLQKDVYADGWIYAGGMLTQDP